MDVYGVARPVAVHADVLDLDALRFELLHHVAGIPRALKIEGMVGHARPGAGFCVENAQAGATDLEPHHVGTGHLVARGLLRPQRVAIETDHRLERLRVQVPGPETAHFVGHRFPSPWPVRPDLPAIISRMLQPDGLTRTRRRRSLCLGERSVVSTGSGRPRWHQALGGARRVCRGPDARSEPGQTPTPPDGPR